LSKFLALELHHKSLKIKAASEETQQTCTLIPLSLKMAQILKIHFPPQRKHTAMMVYENN
jgi:hypothetical protein